MGFFKKRGPGAGASVPPEELNPEAADSQAAPPSGEAEPASAAPELSAGKQSSADPGPDYSREENLLALVNELVAAPAAEEAESRDDDPAPERADDYLQGFKIQDGSELPDLAARPDDQDLERLRRLLLGREIEGLESLHRHLSDPERLARALSRVVTEAIRLRVMHDNELIGVLKPTVNQIVRNSVRNNPNELADNLFPVIGPAIRRSISESIRSRVHNLSRTLEKSFSLTGLKWYLEAKRTGRDFSEVVLLHTLDYQVEQVFFVHTATALPLIHLVMEGVETKDAEGDQVAAMLTVIQQFVNDSFAEGELNTLEFGDVNVYIVQAPQAYLACVVRGQAPPNLRIDMQAALELMVMDLADELDSFKDDTEPFKKAGRHLESLLISRYKDEDQKLPLALRLLPLALMIVILAGGGFFGCKYFETRSLERMVHQKAAGPGLTLLRVVPSLLGRWEITCLKDELAAPVDQALIGGGLPAERFQILYLPFISQDQEIVDKRVAALLKDNKPEGLGTVFDQGSSTLTISGPVPLTWILSMFERLSAVPGLGRVTISGLVDPENGVRAELDDNNVLHLHGRASIGWREAVREKVLSTPGLSRADFSQVRDDQDTIELKNLADEINRVVILFPLDKDQPLPEDAAKLRAAVDDLAALEKLAGRMNLAVALTIYGHTDSSGSQKYNYELSQARAKTLAAMLYARGSSIPISTYGMGADFAAEARSRDDRAAADQVSRKIELRVHLSRRGASLALD
ncbi:MAG: OmpA family protein [Candidatus Adiutrix sp.]|jgi:OOP family OmpA-OmpF porin|nr:OmpA family protein [Candidatus Adiutrix sp.]